MRDEAAGGAPAGDESAAREGVIRFRFDHRREPLSPALADLAGGLAGWRRRLVARGVVGQQPGRYGGAGFGNLSARLPPAHGRGFLVTGSQTGRLADLDLAGFALVDSWDAAEHRLASRGLVPPSSESLTHAALYDAAPAIGAVFHVHAPDLWARRGTPALPATAPGVEYGTPEMAAEVARAARRPGAAGLLAMSGHEDGILAWGPSPEAAAQLLLAILDEL
jgi:ribulose-5-phosphate 4-epimerase/fuculose-1-phosphate aldolase